MSKSFMNKDSGQDYPPMPTHPKKFRPFPSVKLHAGDLKRYQVKNPKWAHFEDTIKYEKNFKAFKGLRKCKSLQITSIYVSGRQVGGTVGHFDGELKYIQRVSKYLKSLDFEAGMVSRRRFVDFRRWMLKQKHLKNLNFVPYYFPVERQRDVQDWDWTRTKGVASLIRSLFQLRQLTLFGYAQEKLPERPNLKSLNWLREFTIKAAYRPEGCDGESDQFYEPHLEMVKKALECKALRTINLQCEAEMTEKSFWQGLKKLIAPVKKPLNVNVYVDYRWDQKKTSEWFKKIFKDLPANVEITYSIESNQYFLSMPKGTENLPVDESDEDDDDDEEEESEDEENEENDEGEAENNENENENQNDNEIEEEEEGEEEETEDEEEEEDGE